jgi:hypothetical protein
MSIQRRSRRRMSPLARRVAELHNDATTLARRLKTLAHDIQLMEIGMLNFDEVFDQPKSAKKEGRP